MLNKIHSLVLIFVILLLSMSTGDAFAGASAKAVTAVAPVKNPVGWWKFDGSAEDSVGNNYGVESGNPAYGAGISGQAINFDGKDDYVVVADNGGSAPIELSTGSFSIVFWVKSNFVGISNSDIKEFIICNGTDGTEFDSGGRGPGGRASGRRYIIVFKDDDLRFIVDDDATQTLLEGASDDFATDDWVHVVAIRDTEAKKLLLYRNGLLEISKNDRTTGSIASPGEPLFIGAKQREEAYADGPAGAPVYHFFKGMLDDLQIYDYALSQAEIVNVMGLSSINVSPPSAEVLFKKARRYDKARRFEEAKSTYQQIIHYYPDSPESDRAYLDISKIDVLSMFDSKQKSATQEVIDRLIVDFSKHPYLPEALYSIAERYQNARKYEQAEALYKKIITDYSDIDSALKSLKKLAILYIDAENETKAQQTLGEMNERFSGRPDFADALYEVAERYEWKWGKYEAAQTIYQQIQKFQGNSPPMLSLALSRMDVISLIESGDYNQALQVFNTLVAKFSKHQDLARTLESIAARYDKAEKYDQARIICGKILADYPGTDYALHAQKKLAITDFKEGNDIVALEALDKLITDFRYHTDLSDAVFEVGEEYYNEALQHENKEPAEQTKKSLQKAIAVWEKVITQLPHSDPTPCAYYFSAICYQGLGEYEKAIEYFRKVVTGWPDYGYAWNAQFMLGSIYENLAKSGVISESEAEPEIRAAYQQLLEKYPSCKAAKYVQRWLSLHNYSK